MKEVEIKLSLYVEDDDARPYSDELCDVLEDFMCPDAEAEHHVCKVLWGMTVMSYPVDENFDRVEEGVFE